jgi:hypothetical protein
MDSNCFDNESYDIMPELCTSVPSVPIPNAPSVPIPNAPSVPIPNAPSVPIPNVPSVPASGCSPALCSGCFPPPLPAPSYETLPPNIMSHRNLDMVKAGANTTIENSQIASINSSITQIDTEHTSLVALTKLNTEHINAYITQLSYLTDPSSTDPSSTDPPLPDLNTLDIPEELRLLLNNTLPTPVESVIEHKDRLRRSIVTCRQVVMTSLIRISTLSANRKLLLAKLDIVKAKKESILASAPSVCLSGEEIYRQHALDSLGLFLNDEDDFPDNLDNTTIPVTISGHVYDYNYMI